MSPITKAFTLLLIGIVFLFVGCGGGSTSSSNPSNLTQAQAQQLGNETYTVTFQALSGALGQSVGASNAGGKSDLLSALRRSDGASLLAKRDTIACSGSNCTISPITVQCPDGGTVTASGSFSGSSSSATLDLTLAPLNCSDGTLVLNGSPDFVTKTKLSDNGTTTTMTVSITGGIAFAPVQAGAFPTGSCAADVTVNVSSYDVNPLMSCTISGTMCSYPVSGSCAN